MIFVVKPIFLLNGYAGCSNDCGSQCNAQCSGLGKCFCLTK